VAFPIQYFQGILYHFRVLCISDENFGFTMHQLERNDSRIEPGVDCVDDGSHTRNGKVALE